jgi:hypothetical protein
VVVSAANPTNEPYQFAMYIERSDFQTVGIERHGTFDGGVRCAHPRPEVVISWGVASAANPTGEASKTQLL